MYRHTMEISVGQFIIGITCDESQVGLVFMFHHAAIRRLDDRIGDHFVSVAITSVIYKDIFTQAQRLQLGEYASLSIGIDNMCREHTIAFPSGISGSVQPSNLILQPGDVPTPILRLYSYNKIGRA